jgi:hypothetical protein
MDQNMHTIDMMRSAPGRAKHTHAASVCFLCVCPSNVGRTGCRAGGNHWLRVHECAHPDIIDTPLAPRLHQLCVVQLLLVFCAKLVCPNISAKHEVCTVRCYRDMCDGDGENFYCHNLTTAIYECAAIGECQPAASQSDKPWQGICS